MKTKIFATIGAVLLAGTTGCITNDIPFPIVPIQIERLAGEGFTCEQKDIDLKECVATLHLDEKTDISKVRITEAVLTEGGSSSVPLVGVHDLRTPIYTSLTLYQTYPWEIRAEQTIAREFQVANQVGAAEFDQEARTVRIYVSKNTDLAHLEVLRMKLGPADITTYSPTLEELSGTSFASMRQVDIRYHDFTERWTIRTEISNQTVRLTGADPWARRIRLTGQGQSGDKMGFRYRKAGEEEWNEAADVEVDGGAFSAFATDLTPQTEYEVMAYSGDEETTVTSVTTDLAAELPNGGFEEWSQNPDKAKLWYPYTDEATRFWDTGNRGATTVGDSNSIPVTDEPLRPGTSGKTFAKLQSKYIIVKFAAGNLFVGEYFTTIGTNGVVGFGQPFPHRPTALKGWVKFKGGPINRVGKTPPGVEIVKGETPESGMIYIALGTWTPEQYGIDVVEKGVTTRYGNETTPIAIYTTDLNSFFNPHSEAVVAYGEKVMNDEIADWQEFRIDLEYRTYDVAPTHLVVVCSASRYGDYFTGCDTSVLCVDDFELIYE